MPRSASSSSTSRCPAAPTIEAAIAEGAPLVWPGAEHNRCFVHELGDARATEAAFAAAEHVVRARVRSQRLAGSPLEPRACLGSYDDGEQRWNLTTSTANPHRIRLLLAEHVFRVPAHRLHVVAGDVGGGFGTKGGLYPEEILVLWAAQRVGRPVKWVSDRSEAFLSDFNGRDQVADAEMALTRDGRVLALRVELNHNLGCQLGPSTAHPPLVGSRMLSGVYAFPAMHVTVNGIFTHSRTLTTYRGAGRPEATLIVERMMDLAAHELGIDPVEIRRRNMIRPEQMPYRTAIGETYDCGEFEAVMDEALELADWSGFDARRAVSAARGLLRGRGVSTYVEVAGTISERMELRFDATGGLSILAGTFSYGQGHHTAYAQMVHDWLGVPLAKIRFVQGDTDVIATGRGTFGSRSMTVGGSALRMACDQIIERGCRAAAILLDTTPEALDFERGTFRMRDEPRREISLDRVARSMFAWGAPKPLPPELWSGLEGRGYYSAQPQNYPNGCYVVEVEVDPDTGRVTLAAVAGCDDVGTVINPLLLEGQLHGAIAQAAGQALKERVVHGDDGQLLTGSFTDYALPQAHDFPRFKLSYRSLADEDEPARRQGRRRSRNDRRAAGDRGRDRRCVAAARRHRHRAAGNRAHGLAGDPRRARTARCERAGERIPSASARRRTGERWRRGSAIHRLRRPLNLYIVYRLDRRDGEAPAIRASTRPAHRAYMDRSPRACAWADRFSTPRAGRAADS